MVALATQKFLSDVAVDALQHCKVRQANAAGSKKGPAAGARYVLTNADLEIIKSSGDDCFADNRCHALLSSTFYLFEPAAALADADTALRQRSIGAETTTPLFQPFPAADFGSLSARASHRRRLDSRNPTDRWR